MQLTYQLKLRFEKTFKPGPMINKHFMSGVENLFSTKVHLDIYIIRLT